MPDMNPDHQIALVKLQNDHALARVGLQGTLWGACAALIAIITIAVVQVATDRYVLVGWAFAAMVAAIVIPVTFYGGFIFKSALNVSAKIEKEGGSFSISSSEKAEPPRAASGAVQSGHILP